MTTKKPDTDLILSKRLQGQLPEIKQYSHEELVGAATFYSKSGLLPEHIKSMEACYIAMRWALALGIDPFLGLRDIFVIDNIPSLRTEAALALTYGSGFMEYEKQYFEGSPFEDSYTAVFKLKIKGQEEHVSKFSVADAKRALLWGKKTHKGYPTAWITYPKRMLMYRAVGFGLRDKVPHVLRGSRLYEEIIDYSDYETVKDTSTPTEVNVEVRKIKPGRTMQGPPDLDEAEEVK